jgi:hypothetical protein
MSEAYNLVSDVLSPGTIIELDDIAALRKFEDMIAGVVNPEFNPVIWAARESIGDLLRPPMFNGRLTDIRLVTMEDPYDRLLDAKERGWQFPKSGGTHRLRSAVADSVIPLYRGFTMLANARSSRGGFVGQVETEAWYYPVPHNIVRRAGAVSIKTYTRKDGTTATYRSVARQDQIRFPTHIGLTVRRAVTKPKLKEEDFIKLDANARRVGEAILRQAMQYPISTPMRS